MKYVFVGVGLVDMLGFAYEREPKYVSFSSKSLASWSLFMLTFGMYS